MTSLETRHQKQSTTEYEKEEKIYIIWWAWGQENDDYGIFVKLISFF